jgi:anti-anti-sigma factor
LAADRNIFKVVHQADTTIIAPQRNLSELDQEVESECRRLEEEFRRRAGTNIVIDCEKTDLLGCSAIGFFVRLWRMNKRHGGVFALCGLSPFVFEILQTTNLDSVWPTYSSRTEALQAASGSSIDPGERTDA